MHTAQSRINHVALVLDGSSSMTNHKHKLTKVADEQIKHLARRSEELDQETRVSVYLFADEVKCLIFDMDVMRLPSIEDLYTAYGNTALIDATIKSQTDLTSTSQIYGQHAFLSFILTDGMENRSRAKSTDLVRTIQAQGPNWTVAFLVPDKRGVTYMDRLGINPGNVAIWDTSSVDGLVGAMDTIKTATETFMTSKPSANFTASGLFSTGADAVNEQTVTSTLVPLNQHGYQLLTVNSKIRIDDRVNMSGIPYRVGSGYYELSKTENIQPQKQIIVVDKGTGQAYTGAQARELIGLPKHISVKVKPDYNPKYKIFVQSTSVNRNLMPNTQVLVLTSP